MEQLEQIGVVGTASGSAPQEILIADVVSLNVIMENIK